MYNNNRNGSLSSTKAPANMQHWNTAYVPPVNGTTGNGMQYAQAGQQQAMNSHAVASVYGGRSALNPSSATRGHSSWASEQEREYEQYQKQWNGQPPAPSRSGTEQQLKKQVEMLSQHLDRKDDLLRKKDDELFELSASLATVEAESSHKLTSMEKESTSRLKFLEEELKRSQMEVLALNAALAEEKKKRVRSSVSPNAVRPWRMIGESYRSNDVALPMVRQPQDRISSSPGRGDVDTPSHLDSVSDVDATGLPRVNDSTPRTSLSAPHHESAPYESNTATDSLAATPSKPILDDAIRDKENISNNRTLPLPEELSSHRPENDPDDPSFSNPDMHHERQDMNDSSGTSTMATPSSPQSDKHETKSEKINDFKSFRNTVATSSSAQSDKHERTHIDDTFTPGLWEYISLSNAFASSNETHFEPEIDSLLQNSVLLIDPRTNTKHKPHSPIFATRELIRLFVRCHDRNAPNASLLKLLRTINRISLLCRDARRYLSRWLLSLDECSQPPRKRPRIRFKCGDAETGLEWEASDRMYTVNRFLSILVEFVFSPSDEDLQHKIQYEAMNFILMSIDVHDPIKTALLEHTWIPLLLPDKRDKNSKSAEESQKRKSRKSRDSLSAEESTSQKKRKARDSLGEDADRKKDLISLLESRLCSCCDTKPKYPSMEKCCELSSKKKRLLLKIACMELLTKIFHSFSKKFVPKKERKRQIIAAVAEQLDHALVSFTGPQPYENEFATLLLKFSLQMIRLLYIHCSSLYPEFLFVPSKRSKRTGIAIVVDVFDLVISILFRRGSAPPPTLAMANRVLNEIASLFKLLSDVSKRDRKLPPFLSVLTQEQMNLFCSCCHLVLHSKATDVDEATRDRIRSMMEDVNKEEDERSY